MNSLRLGLFVIFLLLSCQISAAPKVLPGESLRFIFDDRQLTESGLKPVVQGDTLIFSLATEEYHADASAVPNPVSFAAHAFEFTVEAVPGQRIQSIAMSTSGLRSERGDLLLTNTFAYGKLISKDQFLVNRFFNFSAEDASVRSWYAVNTHSDASFGTGIRGLSTRTLDVIFSHNIRAIALDTSGSAFIDAQDGIGFIVSTQVATRHDRVFDWLEDKLNLTGGTRTLTLDNSQGIVCDTSRANCTQIEGLYYRCYGLAKLCVGSKAGIAFTYHYEENMIRNVGLLEPYFFTG